jgi:hypothetical protein
LPNTLVNQIEAQNDPQSDLPNVKTEPILYIGLFSFGAGVVWMTTLMSKGVFHVTESKRLAGNPTDRQPSPVSMHRNSSANRRTRR